jgi:hypothetical protein
MSDSHNQDGYEPDEISVTPEMIEAGVRQLREHHFGEILEEVVAGVFLVMSGVAAHKRSAASATNAS